MIRAGSQLFVLHHVRRQDMAQILEAKYIADLTLKSGIHFVWHCDTLNSLRNCFRPRGVPVIKYVTICEYGMD